MLAAAAGGLERLCGKDQEATGEERDHRQHIEVDAIGARWIGARLLERVERRRVRARRQERLDAAEHRGALRSLCEAHVEAIQLTESLEAPLRRSDVDERRLPAEGGTRKDGGDREFDHVLADDQAKTLALAEAERGGGGGRRELKSNARPSIGRLYRRALSGWRVTPSRTSPNGWTRLSTTRSVRSWRITARSLSSPSARCSPRASRRRSRCWAAVPGRSCATTSTASQRAPSPRPPRW